MLSKSEYDSVIITAYELRRRLEQDDGSLQNFRELLRDLYYECGLFWPLFYNYIHLLDKEAKLATPTDAYAAGKRARLSGVDKLKALREYLGGIVCSPMSASLTTAIQDGYDLLVKLTEKRGLVQEFISEYRRLYGFPSSIPFFEAGFDASIEVVP